MCWKNVGTVRAAKGDKYLAVICQIITPIAIFLIFMALLIHLANKQKIEQTKKEKEEEEKRRRENSIFTSNRAKKDLSGSFLCAK